MPYRDIGELDRRISIHSVIYTGGVGNEQVFDRTAIVATVWAKYTPQSGNEAFVEERRREKSRATFSIRWREGIDPKMLIFYDGRFWDIKTLHEDRRNRSLDIVAEVSDFEPGG